MPHERSSTSGNEEELEEERRLFFVGITRAIARLHISYARYRTVRGQGLRTIPSQFLFELGGGVEEHTEDREYEYDDVDEDQSAESESIADFSPGQLVRHDAFGLGRVEKFVDMGANSVISVKFNSGQTKSLMVKFANLSKIDV